MKKNAGASKGGGFPPILYAPVWAGKHWPPGPGIRGGDRFSQTLLEAYTCLKGQRFRKSKLHCFFANPKVELKVEDAPIPAMTPKDLKDFLREKSKEKSISELMLSSIRAALPQAEKEE